MSIGSPMGELRQDEEFMKGVSDGVGKGHSALRTIVQDDMAAGMKNTVGSSNPRIFQASLSAENKQVLRVIFQTAREDL